MRWRLPLEEFDPDIVYIKKPKNILVDVFSGLQKQGDYVDDVEAILPFVQKKEYLQYNWTKIRQTKVIIEV